MSNEKETDFDFSTFKERIRALVDSRGKTITALSEELGMSAATLSRYLSGNRSPDVRQLALLSQYFHVSINWLLGVEEQGGASFPSDVQDFVVLYSKASDDDKRIIRNILRKYRGKDDVL